VFNGNLFGIDDCARRGVVRGLTGLIAGTANQLVATRALSKLARSALPRSNLPPGRGLRATRQRVIARKLSVAAFVAPQAAR
jgi:hypothetical protein